jgi:hypothetical protein
VGEEGVYQGAPSVAGRRVYYHSGGLVYHQQVGVFVYDAEGDVFGL